MRVDAVAVGDWISWDGRVMEVRRIDVGDGWRVLTGVDRNRRWGAGHPAVRVLAARADRPVTPVRPRRIRRR